MLLPDSSSFETLINYFSFAAWVFYGGTVAALLWLRYKKPDMERPYKVVYIVPRENALVRFFDEEYLFITIIAKAKVSSRNWHFDGRQSKS